MREETITGRVRAKVICVFRNGNHILVIDGYDATKREPFYCPPGGGIEFGEPSEVALRREIREELDTKIENPKLLGVLECLFTYDGRREHEIVFVYDAELANRSLYTVDRFEGRESDGRSFELIWLNLDAIRQDAPPVVWPSGLIELLERRETTT